MTLMGTQEIAKRLNVTRQRVHELTARPDFPAPIQELASGRIWDADQVEAWQVARERSGVLKPDKVWSKRLGRIGIAVIASSEEGDDGRFIQVTRTPNL